MPTSPDANVNSDRSEAAVLAQATGIYSEQPVSRPLQDHFSCTWVHRFPKGGASSIVIVPDGSIDLQWIGDGWRIAGPDREPQTEILPAGTTIIGFRFRPAAAAAWLGLPASEVLNRRVSLKDFWGAKANRMAEEATETHQLGALICALENALARCAPSAGSGYTDMYAAFELLSTGAPPGKSLIPWLTRELALSERTLRRRFDVAFGYGPKTLDRILRFQRFLKLVRHSPEATAVNLALEAGYADQAHLTRESRRLAVNTPRKIAGLFSERLP